MRIAYLLGSLNRGGTETLILDVFKNAKLNNLDIIGIYRRTGDLENDFRSASVNLYHLPLLKNKLVYLLQLRKILVSEKITIAHAQQPLDALLCWLAAIGLGIRTVLTFHGFDYNDTRLGLSILRFIINRTDRNIYVSKSQKDYYLYKYKLNPKNQVVVHNGVSFDKMDNDKSVKKLSVREELNMPTNSLLMGAVGNFVKVRDQFTICKFLKKLNEQDVKFHFLFIGKRDEKNQDLYDNCVNFIRENKLTYKIHFLGSRSDVPSILKQLDAFVYSSDHDTFGIAVVEAMAAGIPVFVNDLDVMLEITYNGKHATIYRSKDENDLLKKFTHFLDNREEYMQKAIMAKEFVINNYSIQSHIANLKEVYKTVLSK